MGLRIRRAALTLAAATALLLSSGIAYERWSRWDVAQNNPPPGRLVEVDGLQMHLFCTGTGSPTVVLDTGHMWHGSLSWVLVQPEIAKTNRVCSYDRAGIMWSKGYADSSAATQHADRLRKLLDAANEPAPYILVGQSMGGLIISTYTQRYPDEVGGLAYVDSTPLNLEERYYATYGEQYFDDPWWKNLYWRAVAETGVMRLFDIPSGFFSTNRVPAEARLAFDFAPQSSKALIQEWVSLPVLIAEASRLTSLGDRPVIVLTADVYFGPGEIEALNSIEGGADEPPAFGHFMFELHEEIAGLSTIGQHRIAENSGHRIHFQNPDSVIEAIRDVANAVNQSQQLEESPDR